MKIEIKLNQAYGKLSINEPFIIADNTALKLTFSSKTKYDKLVIAMRNGENKSTLEITDKQSIQLPAALCIAGVLEMRVSMLVKGNTVKELDVEPITLKQVLQGFEGSLTFAEVDKQLKQLRIDFDLLKQRYISAFEQYDFFKTEEQNNEKN